MKEKNMTDLSLRNQVADLIKNVLSINIKLPKNQISEDSLFEEYGIDSITALKMVNSLEEEFGTLSKTLFFEYQTISELTDYILDERREAAEKLFTNNTSGSSSQNFSSDIEKSFVGKEASKNEDKKVYQREIIQKIQEILSGNIHMPVGRIGTDTSFEEYGIDSIAALKMTGELEEIFGNLSKTIFYEYQTVAELASYFAEEKPVEAKKYFSREHSHNKDMHIHEAEHKEKKVHGVTARKLVRRVTGTVGAEEDNDSKTQNGELQNIAIIGLALKCPAADNLDEFWNNLCGGLDCITQIPKERFDVDKYYNPDKNESGNIYAKWGGFINGVDEFDPMFFNISPKEAATIEPQDRLFLQCAHAAIEDAGYTKDNIAGEAHDAGVFVGAIYEEYQLYAVQEQQKGNPIAVESSMASIANRVSFYCNFNGPSMSIDTMCSSSMTAIHLACNSLKLGECTVAIAGGVNLSIHPNKYLSLSSSKFLSTNGKCTSFGQGGNGFVPSEGVGALILKPLDKAKEDGDHIYGIIKGTAINHGGKTNGFTVPNPNAQTAIIRKALKQARVNARTVSYIEAHGTGTSLGDPIEINGLTKAFRDDTEENQFCYIGSVKSNIGHCESAAGVASIAKVLLQMKYGKYVPSIHSEELNPYIEFEKTPFIVSRELREWKRPVLIADGKEEEYPRIAGVSGFGAGGSNAHLILQEYKEERQRKSQNCSFGYVILVSGKRKEQLVDYIKEIDAYLSRHQFTDSDLPAIAGCLQLGREAMDYRLGFSVSTMEEMKEKFVLLANHENVAGIYRGNKAENLDLFSELQQISSSALDELFETGQYDELISLWTKGVDIDWIGLYGNSKKPLKISFPTYPFAKEKYWYTDIKAQDTKVPITDKTAVEASWEERYPQRPASAENGKESVKTNKKVESYVKATINDILEVPIDLIDIHKSFESLGFNSVSLVEFSVILNEKFLIDVTPDIFYSYSTVKALSNYLLEDYKDHVMKIYNSQQDESVESVEADEKTPGHRLNSAQKDGEADIRIAIVGISGRFPGADNTEEFWNVLRDGRETIRRMPQERTEWKSVYDVSEKEKILHRKLGVLSGISEFDPAFFEISPREAISMDPKQRILLEEMWKALEDAGYSNKTVEENMGVYIGAEESNYHELTTDISITANHNALLAARLAYFLDIKGANMTINTACSSSLVAFHQAVLSIRSGESDAAVVGGVNILSKPENYLAMEGAGMISKDGSCYAFDKRANGMVPAEAAAVVVIKRLDKAVTDGNHIYATVAGSGINFDGRTNGISAPSGISQSNLIETVYKRFDLDPKEVSYIVAHGTGTILGDPIESNALNNVFKKYTDKKAYCALTSNKPNIGHSLAASGLVSLISLVLAMKHEIIPSSIHSEEENDYINWKDSPFFINHNNREWKDKDGIERIGAVSAFGMSGTNAHVVLKSYQAEKPQMTKAPEHLFVFSAKSEEVLKKLIRDYKIYFEKRGFISSEELNCISYTLLKGRSHFKYRCALMGSNYHEVIKLLQKAELRDENAHVLFGKAVRNFEESDEVSDEIMQLKNNLLKTDIPAQEYRDIMSRLSVFYIDGYDDVWNGVNPGFISLPTYPFLKKTYWPKSKKENGVQELVRKQKPTIDIKVQRPEPAIDKMIEMTKGVHIHLVSPESFTIIPQSTQMSRNQDKLHLRSFSRKSEAHSHTEQCPQLKNAVKINELVSVLVQSLAEELYCEADEIDMESNFMELGLDSIVGVEWVSKLNKKYGLDIKTTKLYQYSNIVEFAQFMKKEIEALPGINTACVNVEKRASLAEGQIILKELVNTLADELFIDPDEINLEDSFTELGLDSIIGVEWISKINKKYELNIKTTQLYNYVTAMEFMKYVIGQIFSGQMDMESGCGVQQEEKILVEADSEAEKELVQSLVRSFAEELFMDESEVDLSASFMELGLDSIIGVEWIGKINSKYNLHINTTKLYQYPNMMEFANYIRSELGINMGRTEEKRIVGLGKEYNVSAMDDICENTFEALLNQIYSGDIGVDEAIDIMKEY